MDIKEINVVREEPAPCHIKLNVEVPQDAVAGMIKEVESEYRKSAQLPGFRKGKAPWKLLRSKYGSDIQDDAKTRLLRAALSEAIDRENLQPETSPHVENQDELRVDPEQEFVFAAEFDVTPEFELPDYKGIEVTRPANEVADDEVDTFIDQLMEQRTSYEKAEKAAEAGDLLKASYEGHLRDDDAAEEELGDSAKYLLCADDTWIALCEPELLPGISEKLVGAEADSDHEVAIDFPDDFYEDALAGKTADYKVHVDEVHVSQRPEFTDDMAKQLGAEDKADAREKIKASLGSQREQQQNEAVREEIVEKLVSRVDFPLPPRVLASETYNTMSRMFQERQRQGVAVDQLREQQDELHKEAEEVAKTRLKRRYVLRKVADAEELKAERRDVQGMIQMLSRHHQMPEKELIERLQQTGGINDLVDTVVENKAIQRLVELANIEEPESGEAKAEEVEQEA